jgi:hypothetical protein
MISRGEPAERPLTKQRTAKDRTGDYEIRGSLAVAGALVPDLTDAQREKLKPLLTPKRRPDGRGRPGPEAQNRAERDSLGLAHRRSLARSARPPSAVSNLPPSLSAVRARWHAHSPRLEFMRWLLAERLRGCRRCRPGVEADHTRLIGEEMALPGRAWVHRVGIDGVL